jgi:hypothetical protein
LKRFLTAMAVLATAVAVFVWSTFPPRQPVLPTSFQDGTVPGILHVHSTRSDGRGTPEEIAHAAAAAGLKFIVLTDHGDATRPPDAPVYREGVLCLDAVEISTAEGHYVALDMPKAPYPLGGEARDVIEDVRRLGGFGIAAHPDSPKPDLRWREWSAPFDGIEFINPDTSWREQIVPLFNSRMMRPTRLLAERLLSYPFRPAESIASLIRPTQVLDPWAEVVRRRPVVTIAGADAHARIASRLTEPGENRLSLAIPSYEASFRAMSVRLQPERALTGEAVTDAGLVTRAIRAGHLYSVLDGAATPPSFKFTATSPLGTAHMGDQLRADTPVTLHVRSNAPVSFSTAIWNGSLLLSGDHHEPEFSVAAPGGAGVYWVEIRAAGALAKVPWLTSNPIYVRGAEAAEPSAVVRPAAASERQMLFSAVPRSAWRVEHDANSLAAVDLPAGQTAGSETPRPQAQFRFGLATGPSVGQFAALVADLPNGLGRTDRITFTIRAEHPMRVSVQLRSERGRWQRSVYAEPTDQERTVFVDDLTSVDGSGDRLPRAEIRNVLFVVDATHTKPGASGRVWITNPALER